MLYAHVSFPNCLDMVAWDFKLLQAQSHKFKYGFLYLSGLESQEAIVIIFKAD